MTVYCGQIRRIGPSLTWSFITAHAPRAYDAGTMLLFCRLVEGEAETKQRHVDVDRALVGILERDLERRAASQRRQQRLLQGHIDDAAGVGAGLHRQAFHGAVVDLELDRLGQADAERKLDREGWRLGVRRNARGELRHELLVLPIDHLLDGAAFQDLAVAGAFDPPAGDGVLGGRWRRNPKPSDKRYDNRQNATAT